MSETSETVVWRETPKPVKVCIDTPGPTVTVEATGILEDITAKALDLYHEAMKDWTPTRGMAAGTGFHTERSWES